MKTYFKKDIKKKRKKKRETDEPYLEFIRQQPCLITGQRSEPHHVDISKLSGMGTKGSDRETIPLSRELHTEAHMIGKLSFSKKYNINYVKEIKSLQEMYTLYLKTS